MGLTEADLTRLGPEAQRQVLKKLTDAGSAKAGKYHNQPDSRGNLRFDSRKEARRYDELMLRIKAVICVCRWILLCRKHLPTWTGNGYGRCRAAAAGWSCDSWRYVVEDVKSEGTRTPQYETKKKLLRERFGLTIREV